jgi:hypothetical protein
LPELGFCDCCGKFTVVHGTPGHGERGGFGRRLMLCDDCCVCHNHCPSLGPNHPAGKYYVRSMKERFLDKLK